MNEIINSNVTFINKGLQKATDRIMKIGVTVRRCAFETAAIMAAVDVSECYKDDGFDSVHDWAMSTFGFKKSSSYTLLKIGREYTYAVMNSKGAITKYQSNLVAENAVDDFNTSQIEKMLPGGHELAAELVEADEIRPEMTCKEIEKVIKMHTKSEGESSEENGEEDADVENNEEIEMVLIRVTDENGNVYNVPVEVLEQYRI